MIDFTAVSREIRSVLSRRRELLTFLGSVFAALGIFLQNLLGGSLPPSLKSLEEHTFAAYALLLMVPSLLLALRLAKLNAGMTLNGVLYARLMQEQTFTERAGPDAPRRASAVNVFGVSFLMFLLSDLLAGFAAALLDLSLPRTPAVSAPVVAAAVVVGGLLLYLYFHRKAAAYALARIRSDPCAPFERDRWEEHVAESLRDANHDMITILALVGLIVFSAFEGLTGLGRATGQTDLPSREVQDYGPLAYGLLMTVTCFMGLVTYVRLRVAVGTRSLQLDPNDRPFRPLRLTDSLLGYMLLAFLFVVSVHFLLYPYLAWGALLAVDAVTFAVALLAEQATLVIAGRAYYPKK
jgi:MFS family permease